MKTLTALLTFILLLAFSGCASMDKRKRCIFTGAAVGAAIGAGSGAVIGNQGDTDNATEGSLIGAAVGGFVGGTIGCFYCKAEKTLDSDHDGVPDDADNCPGTPTGVKVNSNGCPLDSDGDGVLDYKDNCPGTPKGVKVDTMGCPLDSDGDGVPDHRDKCTNTPAGTKVDSSGCQLDSDGDGVYDHLDKCPDTPRGAAVDQRGCWAFGGNVFFAVNKSDIRSEAHPLLNEAVKILKENPGIRVEIQGHTDSTGAEAYNQMLSEKRAGAIKAYLVKEGIDADRLDGKGYGESDPIASNDTAEGRQKNRRVRFKRLP
ncbi:MAG: OmpA family protein [Anaerolineales bacterium]|nr:OmpA family protein [Anaerolineales bacterium]